ncbi:MAG TPA: Lrp/AsnC family transcriptional regulator [Thermoplasmata archaeon]|nr:Lrp/AsnC family transcriptional regulator [Thermoplasmata archaeon]
MNKEKTVNEKKKTGKARQEEKEDKEYEEVLESYFNEETSVKTLIHINVDTKFADTIAQKIAELGATTDVFLVTGDIDIVVKARFESYTALKNFILNELSAIKGIRETRTFLIVSTYKLHGKKI